MPVEISAESLISYTNYIAIVYRLSSCNYNIKLTYANMKVKPQ
jgi:hypothetical protein